jgi:RNA polymerase sigma-32 factor
MSTYLQRLDSKDFSMVPVGNISSYLHWIQQIPMLSEAEEKDLAERLFNDQDVAAARKLVLSHLRFVGRIARGYNGYGLSQEDLIQEGNIGLMKAVKRFDPKVGVRLASFAIHWIRAEIHEFVLRNWRIVKIATTKAQRKLFFNIRKASKKLGWLSKQEAEDLSVELNVPVKEVYHMELRLANAEESFDAPYTSDYEDDLISAPAHYLASDSDPAAEASSDQIADKQKQLMHAGLAKLDARSKDIIARRWLSDTKTTFKTLSEKYKISIERVRQIESEAMAIMRKQLSVLADS